MARVNEYLSSQSYDFRDHPSPTGTDSHFCCTWVASSRLRSLALTPFSCIFLGTRKNWYGEIPGEKITGLVVSASFLRLSRNRVRSCTETWIELASGLKFSLHESQSLVLVWQNTGISGSFRSKLVPRFALYSNYDFNSATDYRKSLVRNDLSAHTESLRDHAYRISFLLLALITRDRCLPEIPGSFNGDNLFL